LIAHHPGCKNLSLYDAADQLNDAKRKEQRGAFFGSIHGTLGLLLSSRGADFAAKTHRIRAGKRQNIAGIHP
jgi:hypothetical protein